MNLQGTLNIFNSSTETKRNREVRIVDKNVNSIHCENIVIKKIGGEVMG